MKKYLLILILALGISAVNAQRTISPAGGVARQVNKTIIYPELAQPTPLPSAKNQAKRIRSGKPSTASTLNCIPIGSAGNAFGTAFGSRTNLWYDKNLNTIAFYHRSTIGVNNATVISDIKYDYSTDGGVTWPTNQLDQGPIYKAGAGDTHRGRYPQGVIYNPAGNTNPTSAYNTVYGPVTDNTNWIENYEGTDTIGHSTHMQQLWQTVIGNGTLNDVIPEGMQIIKNSPNTTTWVVAAGDHTNGYTNDSIFLAKGTFNSGDYNYDFTKTFYAPVIDSVSGVPDIATAWSDDGLIGYVVRLVNDRNQYPEIDSAYVPQVWKTEDGGDHWTLMTTDSTNMNINVLDHVLLNGGFLMTTGFDVDCALDKNNNLHIAVDIGASPGGNSISTAYGNWGVFDIYTTDGGTTWYGQIVGKPESFRGTFGDGSTANPTIGEDNRPQVTRSWDGSKIFISWFDTDTAEFGGNSSNNTSPDWHVRGFDVNTMSTVINFNNNMWTDSINMTDQTCADGFCTFGCTSYYSINDACGQKLPLVYVQLQSPTATGSVVSFNYVDGATVCDNMYTLSGRPCLLSLSGECDTLSTFSGVPQLQSKPNFTVSANYPNPFNGTTMVDVTLTKPSDVTIELSNMVGQVLSTKTYKDLSSGRNRLTIDASDFATSLYLYKVKAGGEVVTRTMSVK